MSVIFINPYVFAGAYDTDAQTYITAVEAADGQALETGVKDAINAFVVGCKADGIWSAIKASCILAGARTRLGALTPLVGPVPTSINFVDGDYDRQTGLKGNLTNKSINSNRAGNADPLSNCHQSVYVTERGTITGGRALISVASTVTNYTEVIYTNSSIAIRNRRDTPLFSTAAASFSGFAGNSRSSSTEFTARAFGSNSTIAATENATLPTQNHYVFSRTPGSSLWSDARIAFYSIGGSLDLALLDSRVTTLINAIAAAIP